MSHLEGHFKGGLDLNSGTLIVNNSVLEIMRLHSLISGNTEMGTRHLYSSFLVFIGMVFPDVQCATHQLCTF
jgi:hypothetical protein